MGLNHRTLEPHCHVLEHPFSGCDSIRPSDCGAHGGEEVSLRKEVAFPMTNNIADVGIHHLYPMPRSSSSVFAWPLNHLSHSSLLPHQASTNPRRRHSTSLPGPLVILSPYREASTYLALLNCSPALWYLSRRGTWPIDGKR